MAYLRGRVDETGASPSDAADALLVAGQTDEARAQERVPDADVAVFGGAGQLPAVRVQVQRLPGQARDPLFVSGQAAARLLPALRLPDADLPALARRSQRLSVGRPGRAQHPVFVACGGKIARLFLFTMGVQEGADGSPLQVKSGLSVFKSQNRTVVSPEPLARCLPSGLKLADMTASECPGRELKENIGLQLF